MTAFTINDKKKTVLKKHTALIVNCLCLCALLFFTLIFVLSRSPEKNSLSTTTASVDQSLDESIYKAAEPGRADGQYFPSVTYANSRNLLADDSAAGERCRKAAELGHDESQYILGTNYLFGKGGVPVDEKLALEWFLKAAKQNNAEGQNACGLLYRDGLGTPKDVESAFHWFREAARQGHAKAQRNLGTCYFFGQGAPKNLIQARAWYKKSAEQGFSGGQYAYGLVWHTGAGGPTNDVNAYMWFILATANGDEPDAVELRDQIGENMSPEDRSQALLLSKQWKPSK